MPASIPEHRHFGGSAGNASITGRVTFASIQFNTVVETNVPAVHLWQSLGFAIIGTAPAAFDHPEHGLVGLHIMFRHL